MDMNSSQRVRAILSFVKVADLGSFAAAARQLGVTSAAVSKNVAGLERALGVRLMNRTTRVLQLTNEGETFLVQARTALETLDAAINTVTSQRGAPSGRVRISTSAAFGRNHLLPILPKLLSIYPSLSVEVDFDDRVVDLVRDGYDIAIRGGNIPCSELITRPVCRLNTILVASPDYLVHHGIPKNPQELRQHRLVARRFLDGRLSSWSFLQTDGGIVTFDPAAMSVLTLSAPEAIVDTACNGVGIAQVAVHLALPYLLSGHLKVVLHQHHHPGSYEMVMQYPHRALIAPRVQATLDYLYEAFANDKRLHIPVNTLSTYAAEAS